MGVQGKDPQAPFGGCQGALTLQSRKSGPFPALFSYVTPAFATGIFYNLLRFGKGENQRRMSAPFSTSTVRVSPVLCTPPMISLAIRVSTRLWMNRFSGRAP